MFTDFIKLGRPGPRISTVGAAFPGPTLNRGAMVDGPGGRGRQTALDRRLFLKGRHHRRGREVAYGTDQYRGGEGTGSLGRA